ncbi:MAG: MFS transporter [Deltaproteobacteria bacterium]|nr:MFS transporter [Deltaproteobacteria bacterium]
MSAPTDAKAAFRRARLKVFGLTWTSYATYYFVRKNLPVAKSAISRDLGISISGLALLDTVHLAVYALGQFVGGWLGDRLGARRLVGFGMLASAAFCAAFGSSSTLQFFALFLGLDGFFEATGWPGTIKAMSAWYGPKERGRVMGLWSTCFQVGPLVATALAAKLMVAYGWRAAFIVPSIVVGAVGMVILQLLRDKPNPSEELELHRLEQEQAGGDAKDVVVPPPADPETVKAARAAVLRNPMVWLLGLSYFGMKLIRYCIDFWQPYYLERALGYKGDTAAYMSTALQLGGIVGAIAIGAISDKWFPKRRGAVATVATIGLVVALALYTRFSATGLVVNVIALAFVGFCLFGPDALISGVAAQDLGGAHAAATVAGIINGCGSVGAIAQGFLVSEVSKRYGWEAVFTTLIGLAAISATGLALVWRLQVREGKRDELAATGAAGAGH